VLNTTTTQPAGDPVPLIIGTETPLDWSGRLSLDLIRQHTKTDDIPGTTDALLATYRAAAVEAAEFYTGLLLSAQKVIQEPVHGPAFPRHHHHASPYGYHLQPSFGLVPVKPYYRVRLQYAVSDGIVYISGGQHPGTNMPIRVKPGTRSFQMPIRYGYLDLTNCCNPCSEYRPNAGMLATYRAGYASAADVPNGVVLGCLQYIAWVLQHPGDEILTVRNRRDARSEGAMGTNNIAIASGALETWRILDTDIL
jgi:hypothetical protein